MISGKGLEQCLARTGVLSVAAFIIIITITEKIKTIKALKEKKVWQIFFMSLGLEKLFSIMTQKPYPRKENCERFDI